MIVVVVVVMMMMMMMAILVISGDMKGESMNKIDIFGKTKDNLLPVITDIYLRKNY